MKYLLVLLGFCSFFLITTPVRADVYTGVQLPSFKTLGRLIPSQYGFEWIKYQYPLNTDPQSLQTLKDLIDKTKATTRGKGKNYEVLISVAKNQAGIETLKNPGIDYQPEQPDTWFSHKYCPWPEELETYTYDCGTDAYGNVKKCSVKARPKTDNGYIKFRDKLRELAPYLQGAGAVEIWNEPNLAFEWSEQNLGPVNPQNYANFLVCGIKGLKKDGVYTNKIISAALAPGASGVGNMDDLDFFKAFYNEYSLLTKSEQNSHADDLSAIGWHSNVVKNIPPTEPNEKGFQRFTKIFSLIGSKRIWLTEFGWRRDVFAPLEDEQARQKQANYIAQAYTVAKNIGNIEAMFVWNFGFAKDATDNPQIKEMRLWDIEGSIAQGEFCQPNDIPDQWKDKKETAYVQDTTLTDDVPIATIAGKALIPGIVIQDANDPANLKKETRVDVSQSVMDTIPGVKFILDLLSIALGNRLCNIQGFWGLGEIAGEYCIPNIAVGSTEKPQKQTVTEDGEDKALIYVTSGQNTQYFSANAKILGKTSIPAGMTLIPAKRDCNIGKLSQDSTTEGEEKLNDLSENLGTTTGFYGNDVPDLRSIAPEEFEKNISERKQAENLNIGAKPFNMDERSPDLCLRQKTMIKGFYPEEVFPASITCDEVWNLLLKINNSQFPSRQGT